MNAHGILTEHSLSTHHRKGREGKGREEGKEGSVGLPLACIVTLVTREAQNGCMR